MSDATSAVSASGSYDVSSGSYAAAPEAASAPILLAATGAAIGLGTELVPDGPL